MRVRVYDKDRNLYFKSEVYAIINQGWFGKYLVLEPINNKFYLKLIDYLDKSNSGPPYPVNINVITDERTDSWVTKEGTSLLKVKSFIRKDKEQLRFDYYCGYAWIFEDSRLLADLINGSEIDSDETPLKTKNVTSTKQGWIYIENQEDIKVLQKEFHGFHDSCLKCLNYISGSEVLEDNSMIPTDSLRQVTMIFDSQWSKSIEMVFEGVLALNLRPAQDNFCSDIFSASIIINDEIVFFCDDDLETEQLSYEGTWIKSLGLRWRQLD